MSGATERETLQELITEAHGAIKDLRGLLREVDKVTKEMVSLVQMEQYKALEEAAVPVIEKFTEQVLEKIAEIDRGIQKRYDDVFTEVLRREGEITRFGESPSDAVRRILNERGF